MPFPVLLVRLFQCPCGGPFFPPGPPGPPLGIAAVTPLMVLQVPVTVSPPRSVKLTWVPSLLPLHAAIASGGGPGGGPLWEAPGGGGGMLPADAEEPDELAACAATHPRIRTSTGSRKILFDMFKLLKKSLMGHDRPRAPVSEFPRAPAKRIRTKRRVFSTSCRYAHGLGVRRPSGADGRYQPFTKSVTSSSLPTCRLQWPCTAGSMVAPSGSTSAE